MGMSILILYKGYSLSYLVIAMKTLILPFGSSFKKGITFSLASDLEAELAELLVAAYSMC